MKWLSRIYRELIEYLPLSIRILMPEFEFINFGLSSCGCLLIDKMVFSMVCFVVCSLLARPLAVTVSLIVARFASGNVNYWYNQHCVFKKTATYKSYFQYWALAVLNLFVGIVMTVICTEFVNAQGISITGISLCVDISLFVISYTIQKYIIFNPPKGAV